MSITVDAATILNWLGENKYITAGDSVMEIGSQQIHADLLDNDDIIEKLGKTFNVPDFKAKLDWPKLEKEYCPGGLEHLPANSPFSKEFYEFLGFQYHSIDLNLEGETESFDLNFDQVPNKHKKKYSLVTNYGTTEHIINQLNAFKAIHDFTAKNGTMVHLIPFQGFPAHGFLTNTMHFYWMLCRSNLYQVIEVDFRVWNRYSLPQNIIDFVLEKSPVFTNKAQVKSINFQDILAIVVLKKTFDLDFVPPVDFPDGMVTNSPKLKKRYWTVFDRNRPKMFLYRCIRYIKNKMRKRNKEI